MLATLFMLVRQLSYGQKDSFSVYFSSGITVLNEAQYRSLDSFLYAGGIRPSASVNITGYADEPGGATLNKSIAVGRASAVKAYLLASGIDGGQIVQCAGAGNVARSGEDIHQRRVDIVLVKPGAPAAMKAVKPKTSLAAGQTRRKPSFRDLKTMKPGELMVIENLQFKVSTDTFELASLPVLKELADVLLDFPGIYIRLEGHICCGGRTDSSRQVSLGYQLSLSRSQAVLKYLLAHGINSSRLSCVGFGFSRSKIFPEQSLQDSYINRRVEIRVVANK